MESQKLWECLEKRCVKFQAATEYLDKHSHRQRKAYIVKVQISWFRVYILKPDHSNEEMN